MLELCSRPELALLWLRLVISTVFATVAVIKWSRPDGLVQFLTALGGRYRRAASGTTVRSLALLELGGAAWLLSGRELFYATLVLSALVLWFSVVIIRALAADISVGCGCFGEDSGAGLGRHDLFRNGFLIGAMILLAAGAGATGCVGLFVEIIPAPLLVLGLASGLIGVAWWQMVHPVLAASLRPSEAT